MRIAQIAPLHESVPPRLYGGTERVVSYLTEELVRQGHDVTLFASGDSKTSARLIAGRETASRLDATGGDPNAAQMLMLERVFQSAAEFDLLHFHMDYLPFPLLRRCPVPAVNTLHGRLDISDLVDIYREYSEIPLISISDAQRRPIEWANWVGTVRHGLPLGLLPKGSGGGDYLAFLGRISPEKRPDRAIRIAEESGIRLKIAAKVDAADRKYFETEIRPLLGSPMVEFIGEIGEAEKADFLGEARALLFPIDWPEPFGLVMIESMACGTPVIAYPRGSVPEIISEGVSGYLVNSVSEAVQAVRRARNLNRAACRAYFERRFSVSRMAEDYVSIYRQRINQPQLTLAHE